jgi:WD40 repeat protein
MRIGAYEVVREVARGGMGIVYLGRAAGGRDVAIKVLLRSDAPALARFERERRLLGGLDESMGFVPLIEAGSGPEGAFLVMPFVPGGTLRDRIERGPLAIDETVALVRTLASAIGRAHERGIVHRDLKPENVLFAADGRPLIADLGLAKHFQAGAPGASRSVALSRTNEVRGTFGYMAPEQARDAASVKAAADVFSLGAILFECLAGEPPFTGPTVLEVARKVEMERAPSVRSKRAETPAWLTRLVARALERDPARRFEDGAALARALEGERSRPRLHLLLGGLAVAVLVGLGIALGMSSAAPRPAPPAPVLPGTVAPPTSAETPAAGPAASLDPRYEPFLRGFRSTKRTTLVSCRGGYAGRHTGSVNSVAESPIGDGYVSASDDRTVKVWTLEGERWSLEHEDAVLSAAYTPDATRIVTVGAEGVLRVWSARTGALLHKVGTGGEAMTCVAVSPGGTVAVAGTEGGALRVFDLDAGQESRSIRKHAGAVRGVAFLRETSVLTGGDDGTLGILSLDGSEAPVVLARQGRALRSVAVSRDGRRALSGGDDGTAILRELPGGRELARLWRANEAIHAVAFSPDGRRCVTGGRDDVLAVWDLASGRVVQDWESGRGSVNSVAFARDGRHVLGAMVDGVCDVFDAETGERWGTGEGGHAAAVLALATTRDGERLVSSSRDRQLGIWDLAAGTHEMRPLFRTANAVAVADDGSRMAATCRDQVVLFDPGEVAPVQTLAGGLTGGHRQGTSAIAFSPDRGRVLSGASDGTLVLWDGAGLEKTTKLEGHIARVTAVGFARDGKRGFSASADRTIRVWDLATGELARALEGPDGACAPFDVGNGGRWTGFMKLENQKELFRVESWKAHVNTVAFSADGTRALQGDADRSLTLWDLDAGSKLHSVQHMKDNASAVALAPDGKLAATASFDRTIRLWRLPDLEEVDRIDLATSGDYALSLVFAGGGRSLFAGTVRGVLLEFAVR